MHRCHGRICRRCHATDDAHRLCYVHQTVFFMIGNDASALYAFKLVPYSFWLSHVLYDLVFVLAHTCLFCSHLCQLISIVVYDLTDGSYSLVHIFLGKLFKRFLRFSSLCQHFIKKCLVIHIHPPTYSLREVLRCFHSVHRLLLLIPSEYRKPCRYLLLSGPEAEWFL